MNVFPSDLPTPRLEGSSVEMDTGLRRTPMSGGVVRQRRDYTHLPQTYEVTWRLTRSQRATLVDFFDGIGVAEFSCPLHVPGDPRPWRSVWARLASDLAMRFVSPSHDDVAVTLTVDEVEIVLDFGDVLAPGGDDAAASDGEAASWEETI